MMASQENFEANLNVIIQMLYRNYLKNREYGKEAP